MPLLVERHSWKLANQHSSLHMSQKLFMIVNEIVRSLSVLFLSISHHLSLELTWNFVQLLCRHYISNLASRWTTLWILRLGFSMSSACCSSTFNLSSEGVMLKVCFVVFTLMRNSSVWTWVVVCQHIHTCALLILPVYIC